jgi:orotidine-5'-phosphate decarboxylase
MPQMSEQGQGMTFAEKLRTAIGTSGPGLCVGLDPDPARLPEGFRRDLSGIVDYLHKVIRLCAPWACAFKVNTAFYEAFGSAGWRILEEIAEALPEKSLRIADAKRGDIGNTAERYAEAFLHRLPFDAVTVNPYLGGDSLQPFVRDPDRGAFVLALTTNPGSKDLQYFSDGEERLYERVLKQIPSWALQGNLGAVVGATHPQELLHIREAFPTIPLLIPGVGAQGGDIQTITGMTYGSQLGPVLVNVSRGVLYPDSPLPFPENVREACQGYADRLRSTLRTTAL